MPDVSIRVFSQHLMQGVWCIVLALLFLYTFNVYRKHYLKLWSLSWWAFALYMLATSGLLYLMWIYNAQHPLRISLTVFSIFCAYVQVFLLFAGTWELIREKRFNRSLLYAFVVLALLAAVVSAFAFIDDPGASGERFFIRVSIKAAVTGMAFLGTGIWILSAHVSLKGLGKKLLSVAFIVFGLEQFSYFFIGLLPLLDIEYEFEYASYLGLMDLFLQSLMGMGMAIWLLENERRDLKKANAELDSFFYSTSHDLRSPIASILGLTYLAKYEIQDEQALQIFDKIESRVQKLDEVINDILNYSKSSKRALNITRIDFNELLREVLDTIEFTKGASAIHVNYEDSEKNWFYGDLERLLTILNNLIANSVKYHDLSKKNPFIKITFKKVLDQVTISVEDNGIGIDPKHHGKIFDMFYRANSRSQGSGLGLFIVKEAVKKLNGQILLESIPGQGSAFKVILPEPLDVL